MAGCPYHSQQPPSGPGSWNVTVTPKRAIRARISHTNAPNAKAPAALAAGAPISTANRKVRVSVIWLPKRNPLRTRSRDHTRVRPHSIGYQTAAEFGAAARNTHAQGPTDPRSWLYGLPRVAVRVRGDESRDRSTVSPEAEIGISIWRQYGEQVTVAPGSRNTALLAPQRVQLRQRNTEQLRCGAQDPVGIFAN